MITNRVRVDFVDVVGGQLLSDVVDKLSDVARVDLGWDCSIERIKRGLCR